ncbi:hypothetical protein MBLNU230_g0619t1 [Neophaeotheca triangularis]
MEHYEETKKVSKGWWQIRRAHKKDLGNLKDCSLAFRTHLRELLLPLLLEETTDRSSYDDLLANPGGAGWRGENVDRALAERLSDHHERYLEILKEMAEAMAKLSSECKVEDKEFQAGLAGRQSQTQLSLNANVRFEAKRAAYALTAFKRDSLLAEVERYVHKLKEILAANDRVNAITGRSRNQTPGSGVPKAFLQLWQHAESIFKLGVAQEWAQDVELEAGEDYATAVEWCLQRSPNFVRNEKWREEFVRNVVQPLQRCYECMAPRKIT